MGTGIYIDDIEAAVASKEAVIAKRVQTVKTSVQAQVAATEKQVQGEINSVMLWIGILSVVILIVALGGSLVYIQKSINI